MDPRERPNVVLVVLDTVRARNHDLYGYDRETMPNLAAFAADANATTFPRA
jgi:glucan phosphoethanolaminetransferase (alkaline phosphatase superfamily)